MSINQYTNDKKRLDFYCDNITANFLSVQDLEVESLITDNMSSGSYASTSSGTNFLISNDTLQIENIETQNNIKNDQTLFVLDTAEADTINSTSVNTSLGIFSKFNYVLTGQDVVSQVDPILNVGTPTRIDEWRYKLSSNIITSISGPVPKTMLNIKLKCFFNRAGYAGNLVKINVRAQRPPPTQGAMFINPKLASIKGSAQAPRAQLFLTKHPILLPLSDATFTNNYIKLNFARVTPTIWDQFPEPTNDYVEINLDVYVISEL